MSDNHVIIIIGLIALAIVSISVIALVICAMFGCTVRVELNLKMPFIKVYLEKNKTDQNKLGDNKKTEVNSDETSISH